MDYRIEFLEAFWLLGKAERQPVGNVQTGSFWDRCQRDGTLTALAQASTSPDNALIGVADATSSDGESYTYSIATPYDGKSTPDGFIRLGLPASLWVKFRCADFGARHTADKHIWSEIYSGFFPASAYEPAEYQLEVYPYGDDALAEIWISLREKTDCG